MSAKYKEIPRYTKGLDPLVVGQLERLLGKKAEEYFRRYIYDIPLEGVEKYIRSRESGLKEGKKVEIAVPVRLGELKDMQTIGVGYMYLAKHVLLGDEVGLGKTVQVAGLINVLKAEAKKEGRPFSYCFITESGGKTQIQSKLFQFTREYAYTPATGGQADVERLIEYREKGLIDHVVAGHSLLSSASFVVYARQRPFDLFILDESSVIKTKKSQVYKNTRGFIRAQKRRILLNATPLEQGVDEFYNQLELLEADWLPNRTQFHAEFCKMTRQYTGRFVFGGPKDGEIFRHKVGLRYLARTRAGEGAKYEENKYKLITVPLSPEQKYLHKTTTLYQMACDYPPGVDRHLEYTEQTTPKLGAVKSLLRKQKKGTQALIYCRYIKCQAELRAELIHEGYTVRTLNGRTPKKKEDRAQLIKEYNEGKYDILITNIQKCLDLNACTVTIIYTVDSNPQKMVQLEGRMTREFDVRNKELYILASEGRETKALEVLRGRVKAAGAYTYQGKSMVLSLLD